MKTAHVGAVIAAWTYLVGCAEPPPPPKAAPGWGAPRDHPQKERDRARRSGKLRACSIGGGV